MNKDLKNILNSVPKDDFDRYFILIEKQKRYIGVSVGISLTSTYSTFNLKDGDLKSIKNIYSYKEGWISYPLRRGIKFLFKNRIEGDSFTMESQNIPKWTVLLNNYLSKL